MKHILNRVISIFTLLFLANWCHAEGTWILVTDVSDLQTGDKVIIVARDYDRAMGKSASGATYQPSVGVTLEGETCIVNDEVQILDVTSNTDDSFYLKIGDKYLYADKSISTNDLVVGTQSQGYSKWNITIVNGATRIKAQGKSTYNPLIQYYASSKHFGCYSDEGQGKYHVSLYKFVEGQGEVKEPAEIILVDAGKQSSDTIKTYIGSSYPLPTRGSSIEGLEFMGWSSTPIVAGAPIADVAILSPGTSVKVEENMIFYAVYAKAVYSGESAYVKIGPEQEDLTGDYLIVYENGGKIFKGSLGETVLFGEGNAVDIELLDDKIALNNETESYEFRIDKYDEGYSVKSKSGLYIGFSGTKPLCSTTLSSEFKFNVEWSEEHSPIRVGQSYYLCYSSKGFTFSFSQHTPIQLYKRTDVTKSYAFYTTSISIDVPINKYGYATWYAGMPVEVPDELNAFTCQVEGNTAMLHAVGTVIPAHTGVVLYAAEAVGKGQNVVLSYANVDTTPIASNALIGFVEDTKVDNGKAHYALNVKNNVVGFYIPQTTTDPVLSATSAFTAIAGKAYLELDAQMSISALELKRIDDVSVNQISTSSIDIIYDLMGRKVSSPSKGIYVVNGRKMVLTGEEYKTK